MRKYSPHMLVCLTIILTGIAFSTHVAQADTNGTLMNFFGIPNFYDLILQFLANIFNYGMMIAAWLLAVSGTLLNVSLVITLHIKDFVNSTPAIYQVWTALRDVSGMFIIFALLYAAIKLILGFDANFGGLIKNIVIAGVLINFSFFAVGVLIDASNVVSLAIYNAMVPSNLRQTLDDATESAFSGTTNSADRATALGSLASSALKDGGLAAIFMQNLKIQSFYNESFTDKQMAAAANGQAASATENLVSAPLKIILVGSLGIFIMLISAAGFAAAALAFVIRLIILLFLLMFSPIWCAAAVIPGKGAGSLASKWTGQLTSQLTFMPVYLLLMWVALVVLNGGVTGTDANGKVTSGWLGSGVTGNLWQGDSKVWGTEMITLVINFAIVIIMLSIPLVVAISMSGWTSKAISWGDPRKLWRSAGSQAGSRTLGRAAYYAKESNTLKRIASLSPLAGRLASGGLTKVSTAGFGAKKGGGYEDRLKAKNKSIEAMHKQIGSLDRSKYATEADFQNAKRQAEGYQEKYRAKLPWKGTVGGVVGFMLDNRANRQSALSLTDEAELGGNRKKLKRMDDLEKELVLSDVERNELRKLKAQEQEIRASIERASKSKKKKDRTDAAKILAEELKEEEGEKGSGGEKKEEKPKKEEPKENT